VATPVTDSTPEETAWRIHAAVADWTGKVDTKASFALAIESAIMLALVELSGEGRRLSGLSGSWTLASFWAGVLVLTASLLCVAWVVRPRLRTGHLFQERHENFVYFGHLRYWDVDRLVEALRNDDVLPMLSRQLVRMSRIAWEKHRLLQLSMTGTVLGVALVASAAALNG
jgi:hypothetical protein